MSGQADNFEEGGGLPEVLAGVREVEVVYMNVGRSCDATHEFLERCARKGMGVAFVEECWVKRGSGRGTQLHPDYVRVGGVSAAQRVACFVLRSLVRVCHLVEGAYRFVCVEIGG